VANYLENLLNRMYYNPLGTYSPDEMGPNPVVTGLGRNLQSFNTPYPPPQVISPPLPQQTSTNLSQGEVGGSPWVPPLRRGVATLGANLQGFNTAQPYPPRRPPDLPIQTPTELRPEETDKRSLSWPSLPPVDRNPLGIYSPDETSDSAVLRRIGESQPFRKIGENLKAFSEAKPGQNIFWSPSAGLLPSTPATAATSQMGPEGVVGGQPEQQTSQLGPEGVAGSSREVDGSTGDITEGERLGVHDPHTAPGAPLTITPTTTGQPPSAVSPAARQTVMSDQSAPQSPFNAAGILGGIGDWLSKHQNQLLAISAGMSGAPGLHQGIGRAAAYSIPAIQQDIAMQQQQGGMQASYNALLSSLQNSGMDPQQAHNLALAGATNPKLFDSLMTKFASPTKYEKVEVEQPGMFGPTKRVIMVDPQNPADHFYLDEGPGSRGGVGGGGGGGTGSGAPSPTGPTLPNAPAGSNIQQTGGQPQQLGDQNAPRSFGGTGFGFFAPGYNEQNFDQNKVADEFLNQFSPVVQSDIKAALAGTFNPAGRQAYGKGIESFARLYGAGIGQQYDPVAINARKAYESELGGTTKGAGLRAFSLGQGLDHFVSIADDMMDAHLSGFPWKRVAHGLNRLKAESSEMEGLEHRVGVTGQGLTGEVGALTSGTRSGGVHERAMMKGYLSDIFQSRQGAAGSLEGMLDLLKGGLEETEADRDRKYGDDPRYWPKGANFVTDKERAQIAHIEDVIEGLKTGKKVDRMVGGDKMHEEAAKADAAARGIQVVKPGSTYNWDPTTKRFTQ